MYPLRNIIKTFFSSSDLSLHSNQCMRRPWVLSILEMKKLGHGDKQPAQVGQPQSGRNSKLKNESLSKAGLGGILRFRSLPRLCHLPLCSLLSYFLLQMLSPQPHACPTPQCLRFALSCLSPRPRTNYIFLHKVFPSFHSRENLLLLDNLYLQSNRLLVQIQQQ